MNNSNSSGSEQERQAALQKLVDSLQDLIGLGGLGGSGNTHVMRVEDAVVADSHQVGADAFFMFEKRANHLDKELTSFVNATRTLSGSAGIRAASVALRNRLAQILLLFHKNAKILFPVRVPPVPQNMPFSMHNGNLFQNGKSVNASDSNAENWPEQLEKFAADIHLLVNYVDDYSTEFMDDAVSATSLSLVTDLKYWASCLKTYKGQFESREVQTYLHELTEELGQHLETVAMSLSTFIEIVIPLIRHTEEHKNRTSTVATFFSAVTATTLQFSFNQTPATTLSNLVNVFWFSSLLLSSGAALNTWLALTWYGSTRHPMPLWVKIWIAQSPPVFLILSSTSFLIGLVLFVYSSGQAQGTRIMTSFVFACSCLGLFAIPIYFAAERWIFSHYKGVKRLSDILDACPGYRHLPLAIASWLFQEIQRATYKLAGQFVMAGYLVAQTINTAIVGARERRQTRVAFPADMESHPIPNRGTESSTGIPPIIPLTTVPESEPTWMPGADGSEKYDEDIPADNNQTISLRRRLVNKLRSTPSEIPVSSTNLGPSHPQRPRTTRIPRRTGSTSKSMDNLIRSMIVYGRAQSSSTGNGATPPKRKRTGSTIYSV